ncbi:hypothetical protein B0T26DRAFT_633952 [Lasiosphaeria miniovina]|uniref:Ecp2 effector protein-like domain-containing protein n=1 Tax=Lasiosphaeria miniovina TaxID=1954250 RepID=A0AA40BF26_9PEZI|nr:uncharacterized protein B0T26DRAFT_633952 [Lasiosphaeria miniovina]KAK0733081.1 hypothetical protein B0T26DRAFT_633952 [Lasiosphaeria miniovina]
MHNPSLRTLLQQAVLGYATLSLALAGTPDTAASADELVARELTLADGTTATILEHPSLLYARDVPAPPKQQQRNQLAARATYSPCGGGFWDDLCGEGQPRESFGAGTPVAADCRAIADAYPSCGYWTVKSAELVAAGATPGTNGATGAGGWVTLAQHGTCRFRVQLQTRPLQTLYFGTNDLRFYTYSWVGDEQNGHIQAVGGVICNNNTAGAFLGVGWGLYHT